MKECNILIPTILLLSLVFSGCKKETNDPPPPLTATVSSDFDSGSIGEVVMIDEAKWEFHLKNDNNNPDLPDSWRNWWYVNVKNISIYDSIEIILKNRGWPYYYLPVYSYNQSDWLRFTESEVTQNQENELIIRKQFEKEEVWIARFYPYTFADLENYLVQFKDNQYLTIETAGATQNGKPLYALKVTDPNTGLSEKERIFMHARTHPAETPSSFLIEGMLDFLLGGSTNAVDILSRFEFYIFPMQNTDGVSAGNYRSTPLSENLEVMWFYQTENPLLLTSDAPQEVSLIHQYARNLMEDGGPKITMALNLHASNSEPDIRPFFYPHFGNEAQGYAGDEAALWQKQIRFISSVATYHGFDMIEPPPAEGGSSFASKTYPESWWWVNYKDNVMAMTMEMTYGRAGYTPRWIVPDDLRDLGQELAFSIRDYYDDSFSSLPYKTWVAGNSSRLHLSYPDTYPPMAEDEGKE